MLKLQISLHDVPGPWVWADGQWTCGGSWIRPVEHQALQHRLTICSDGHVRVLVRERCQGRDHQSHDADWPGDYLTIDLADGSVQLRAGVRGVAPIYLAADGHVLHGSWDMADLRELVDVSRLVAREAARLLTMRFRYGHDTLFAGVRRLTERSTATFDTRGLRLAYPQPALHSTARRIREGADVIGGYERLLHTAVTARVYDPSTACVELSGGLDSANVATTLGTLHPGEVSAAAMMVLGEVGVQQAARRADFITLLSLGGDVPVSFEGRLPLSPGGRRASGRPVTPYEDPYDEAKAVMLERLGDRGLVTVFTGVGGDEMVARTAAEVPHLPLGVGLEPMPWIGERTLEALEEAEEGTAPAAVVNEMTLTAQACAAPPFLRAGMWPVHPLSDSDLVRFGEWLPLEWRRHKRLHRERLERAGCPAQLLEPRLRENFTPVMRAGLRRHGLALVDQLLTGGSPLIDAGFVDADGLAAVHRRLAGGGEFRERETELYGLIVLDLALRSFA